MSGVAIALLLIGVALLIWAWFGGEPPALLPALVVSIVVGAGGLIGGVERGRIPILALLILSVAQVMAMTVVVGTRSMKECELEEGFLIGYAITRVYDPLANTVECRRTSEAGEVKISKLNVWELLHRR